MTAGIAAFDLAGKVADAVLYEGYVLYPYRATAPKNRLRWQFGVLVPPGYPAEPSWQRTETVVEGVGPDAELHLVLRFLQLQVRTTEGVDPSVALPWEEGIEHRVEAVLPFEQVIAGAEVPVAVPGGEEREVVADGVVLRQRWDLSARVEVGAEAVERAHQSWRLRVVVRNEAPWDDARASRSEVLRRSLLGAHLLLGLRGGAAFVSLLEPPEWAEAVVDGCSNRHTFPVLVGEQGDRDAVLSSPVLMYDYPEVAPESPGDFYDATEIDELLTLRTLTLTEEEKRQARLTDPRAAAIVERVDSLPPEAMDALHGTFRMKRAVPGVEPSPGGPDRDSGLATGHRVRLRPRRSADAQDMFLEGKVGVVHGTKVDVDGTVFVTVTVEDDPAAELHDWYGRYLYFRPDELERLP